MEVAITAATEVQYALQFGGTAPEEQREVCPVQRVLQYWP